MEKINRKQIKTQGLKFVLIGIMAFAIIIGLIIMVYHVFIEDRVIQSREYEAASHFVANSYSLKKELLSPIEAIRYDDMTVYDSKQYGMSVIYFKLLLKDGISERLRVVLIKVGDFWLVYQATLNPELPLEKHVVSTYQKVLAFLERVDFGDFDTSEALLELIKMETISPFLTDYLSAKLHSIGATQSQVFHALSLLDNNLLERLTYGKISVLYQRGKIYFQMDNYDQAIKELLMLEDLFEKTKKENPTQLIFSKAPRDPLTVLLEPVSVLAEARLLLTQAYMSKLDYAQSLEWAVKTKNYALIMRSSVLYSKAIFLEAQDLYHLGRFQEADVAFKAVINNIDNPDLRHKAWAFYFRAEIAAKFNRHQDSLDFFETAVNLQPNNSTIRKGAIEYLLGRNQSGDMEIALALSLRGMDYGFQKDLFRSYASRIYSRLGLSDKTLKMK